MVKISSNILAINAVAGSLLDDLFDDVTASTLKNGAISLTLVDQTTLVIPSSPTLLPDGVTNPAPNAGSTHPVGFTLDGIPIRGVLAGNNCDVTPIALKFSDECFKTLLPITARGFEMDMAASTEMYFVPPMCLYEDLATCDEVETTVGYALDGFPIKMSSDPPAASAIDECGGGYDADGNYRYLFQDKFPYSVSCFKGELSMKLPMDDVFYYDGGACKELYEIARGAQEYVKLNNGGQALHDYLNYGNSNKTTTVDSTDSLKGRMANSNYRASSEDESAPNKNGDKKKLKKVKKPINPIAEKLRMLFDIAKDLDIDKMNIDGLKEFFEKSRKRREEEDCFDCPSLEPSYYTYTTTTTQRTSTYAAYDETDSIDETMPAANFTMDLQKEYPLLFAPFGFVRFEEFQYCEDGSGCVTICSQRNLRSRCKEDIVACNDCEDEIPVVEKKCLGFQGLYRPAYTCQIKNGSEIIEEFTSPYGSYNSGEFNLYPRMGNETDISCFFTDILGRKVEDKESGCPANLVRSSKEKISAFETCTRDSAATLPLEFNEAANLDLPDVLGASANLLNSCVCPEGKVWSFLQNWCIPRSSCSSMEFEVPVPCETRAEVHKANGWYPLTCKNEEDYFPKSCMVFNEIYNLCFEVDDNGDIDRDGRLDIIDMTAEPVKPDNGLEPGQFYSPWEPVDSWSYQDYYNESITYQRTSLDKYTYEFKEDNCFPIRAELYFPIDHASFEGYSRVLLEENNWSHFSYYCRCMEAEGDGMCDPGQMVRFVCEDFPEDYGNTDSYDDYGSIVYPSYPEYGNYEDWEYNNYDSDSLQAMAPKIISNVMDQLIWGQLSKYSCMEMFLLQRYHSAGTYSCTDAIKNVYTECLKTSFSMAGEEIATMLAETESKAIEYFFCKKNLTPMTVESYFSYWDESVWDVFYGGIVDKYNLYDLDSGRKRRSHETNLVNPYAQTTTPGYVDYDWSETSGNDSDDEKRKLTKDDVYQLIKIGAHIVESNLATLVTSHAVNISAASVANSDNFYSGMCTLWGEMQKSIDKAAKEGIKETIHGDSIAEMLSVFNLTDSECYEIKEKIEFISPEIGMTWELTSSFNPFCENKEQWPKLPDFIKEEMGPFELRCEIHQFADQVVQCFNEYILGRVPHGDNYWKNILRAGVCSYSRISRNCLGMPWVEADIEELYEEVLDDMFRYDEEHVFNAFAMIALDKIRDFPTEFDEFIHWAWAEAQRFLPEDITREIEIYVGNPAEKLLKFVEELEDGLLINKSGIERPLCNMGTQFLTFLKTILFEDETALCSFMSSAIETHKAFLYKTHANFENFSKFCTFVVDKFSDMFEDMFLREYIKKMLLEEGVIPPIFINIALKMFDTKTAYEIRKFSKWEKQECTYLPHWSEWSQCSETCDGGYRHRAQICMDKTMSQVSNILCGPDLLFSISEPCNTFECALSCSVMANVPDEFNITTYKVDCKDRKLTVFPFTYENGRLRVNGVNYPARKIESFDFCNNYFEDSQWEAIEDFIGQSHKTKEFNFSHNKFETLPVSVLQRLTKGAELNMDGNEICKFDCEGFDLRQFSGKLNLCLQNNPISSVPFEFIPAMGYFNKFEYDDGVLGRNKST